MTQRILGEDYDGSAAQSTFDRLLKAYFTRLLVIDAPATSDEGRSRELASDTGSDCAACTVHAFQPAGNDKR
jgi:hypothetical protein